MTGDAAVEGAVVAVVVPVAGANPATPGVAVSAGDAGVEVVPATTGTDVVDGVETAGAPLPAEGSGAAAEPCARSGAPTTRKATTMVRLRKEFMNPPE